MSQPTSRQPSQSAHAVPSVHPAQSQSQASTPFKSARAILNRKLIPRDYLNNGKVSPLHSDTTDIENVILSESQPLTLRSQISTTSLAESSGDVQSASRVQTVANTSRSGQASPDSDTLGYEDLKIAKTRSPESPTLPPYHGFAKPDSPTIRFDHADHLTMPRTSSIDSAISSVSNHSVPKTIGDVRSPSPASVRNLVATAGGAENLISHLLKDKNNVTSQNAQLWRLVEKQRALLLGLNKDLERVTKDRDRYKKKVKELQQSADGKEKRLSVSPRKPTRHGVSPVEGYHREATDYRQDHHRQGSDKVRSAAAYDSTVRPETHHVPRNETVTEPHRPPRVNTDHDLDDQPTFALTVATPDKLNKTMASSRKAPPKPLNLIRPNDALNPVKHQTSAASQLTTFEEEPERGRRRTREDDDRDRELSAIQAEEARSRSKKQEKQAKAAARAASSGDEHKANAGTNVSPPGLPLSPRPQHAQTFLSQSSQAQATVSLSERMLAGALKSPGLPVSPRPMHNPGVGVSLPLSPRANMFNPLSPRAPKQPIPLPMNPAAPIDPAALQATHYKMPNSLPNSPPDAEVDRLQVHRPPTSEAPSVYRGLMAANYPNLLLPPNALPSIQVKVAFSRSKPSRHSMLGFKMHEDSTVFSLSIISRSSNSELWRIDKVPSTLSQLEQVLRLRCSDLPRLPDRKLFAGNSPASLDARRKALDDYFDELLDTQIDEQAAVSICTFLSTDVIDPDLKNSRSASATNGSPTSKIGRATKTGYLTKKGKNFGGWKTRYFILESSELRYYETPNGSHLGTIKLQNADIGKQNPDEFPTEDLDAQFRHAFLIQEPRRKDSGTYLRHVLCAESDAERDDWVRALGGNIHGSSVETLGKPYHELQTKRSVSAMAEGQVNKETYSASPTPTSGSSTAASPAQEPLRDQRLPQAANISGPMNGSVITDTSTWGHKAPQIIVVAKDTKDKTSKMTNIFGFKKTDGPVIATAEQKSAQPPRILRHNGYVRPVFGLPLAEAIEFCAPFNVEIDLPAVVYRSIEYLRAQNAAQEEGLFRLSGSNTDVRNLKERFNTEGDVDLVADEEYHDVHAVTSLFKSYLRELPSTLLTRDLHLEFAKVLELPTNTEKITAFNYLVHQLPRANFVLLKELSRFLLEVTQSCDKNKMTVRNMGIVFSPTLNIPTPVFTLFLTEYHAIFEREGGHQVRAAEASAQTLGPTDIRSPRHQMFSDIPTPAYHQTQFPGLPTNPQDKDNTPVGEMGAIGFVPVQPSYETGNYVSQLPGGQLQQGAAQTTSNTLQQVGDPGTYTSLNGLLAPNGPSTTRTPRRESAMIYASVPH